MTKLKTLLMTLTAAGLCIGSAAAAEAPQVKALDKAPQSILVVGNSYMYYNCGINGYLSGILKASGKKQVKTRIAAIGRGNQSQYPLEEYLDNAAAIAHQPKYGKLDEKLLKKEIKKRENYELVLMQGSNRGKDDQLRDAHYVKIHADAIRAQGGIPAMIITWTQKKEGAPDFDVVADGVTGIANANNMMAIPVGQAFNLLEKEHPELTLIMPDKTHPTAIGSWLMAATIYASVYGADANEGVKFEGGCEKPIAPEVRAILADTANRAVKAWFGR